MNLSLIASFTIGSILVLSLVKVNMGMIENSMDSMNDQVAKVNISAITSIAEHDFRKIGYRVSGNSIQEATAAKISFTADVDNDGAVDQVTWEYDKSQAVTESTNPNDYLLKRSINGADTPIKLGVVKFRLRYYDSKNQETSVLDKIRRVDIQMLCESAEPIDGKYMKAGWSKTFTPINIIK